MNTIVVVPSLKLTANAPENRQRAPKGNEKVFQASIFRCKLAVSFTEGIMSVLDVSKKKHGSEHLMAKNCTDHMAIPGKSTMVIRI